MSNEIERLLRIVNVNHYAKSKQFLGYFESVIYGKYKNEAINLFINSFDNMLHKCTLISSLTKSVIKETVCNEETKNVISNMISNGWVEINKNHDEIMKNFQSFRLSEADIESIRQLCDIVIEAYTYGHTFFFWEDESLVIYPHEDYGFGVLASPKTQGEIFGLIFLKQAEKTGYFNVDILR